jgi:hypothetical protein
LAFSTLSPLALFAAGQGGYGHVRQQIHKIAPAAKDEPAQQENGMKLTPTALTLVLAASSLAMVSPAMAQMGQYGSSAQQPKVAAPKAETPTAESRVQRI